MRRPALIAVPALIGCVMVASALASHFTSETKLNASDASALDFFGRSASISDDTIVVGAYRNEAGGTERGAAYVFARSGSAWPEQQKLTAGDGADDDFFGWSSDIDGNVIAVGSPGDDDKGDASGSAYMFRRSGSFTQEQKLLASDGVAEDRFGDTVAVSGNVVVVGAPGKIASGLAHGSAYVFRFQGTSWVQEQKLTASDGAAADNFGESVDIHGDVIVVGAPEDDDVATGAGSAYVFRFNGLTWVQEKKLTASDGGSTDRFGIGVSVHDDLVVVGADGANGPALSSGAAYVFTFDGLTWNEDQKLTASDGENADAFGLGITTDGVTIVVGAPQDDFPSLNGPGSAYVFLFDGSTWVQDQKLSASDKEAFSDFGGFGAVSVDGDTVVIGADGDGTTGSAYVYTVNQPPVADAGPDTVVECTSAAGTTVHLDGSGSTDPDSTPGTNDDIVSFRWFEDFGLPTQTLLGVGETLDVVLPHGVHTITLEVTDSAGHTDTDEVVVSIVDTEPPDASLTLTPNVLWPPNHKLTTIVATLTVSDGCCPHPSVTLVSITSNEPDEGTGDGNQPNDIQDADFGTDDRVFRLRAERSGNGSGRVYTVTYRVEDCHGNFTEISGEVRVPHNQ
jgi:hypothetical protein